MLGIVGPKRVILIAVRILQLEPDPQPAVWYPNLTRLLRSDLTILILAIA